jgi:two-component system cell cycle sensor histidine kinase/response regulator CckA
MPRRTDQEQAALVARLIENATDVITVIDDRGAISFQSPSVERVLGYRPEELEGTSVFDLVHPEDLPGAATRMTQVQDEPGPTRVSLIRLRHRDGSYRTLEAVGTAMFDDPLVGGIVVNARDVTERIELEAELLQAQKLQVVGRIAAGVAHDFNNLFTVIEGHSALVLASLDESDPRRADVAAIAEAAHRAAQLTRRLVAFNRSDDGRPQVLELNAVVTGVAATIRPLVAEAIELDLQLDPNAGEVRCDPTELEQVILNLVLNARDAVDIEGRISISTSRVTLEPSDAHVIAVQAGSYARVAVADTGKGMDEETQARVFEPFFTTKGLGMGTGLGLASVHRMVDECGGTITIESNPARGSRFTVYLPVVPTPDEPRVPPRDDGSAHGVTVLVVEDDDRVRSLTQRLLETAGYDVVGASSGPEALEVIRTHTGRIDLLFTDVVMPGMHGPELARESLKIRPDLATLFTSGFTEEALAANHAGEPIGSLLAKPFLPDELFHAVRQALAERTTSR